MLNQMKKIAALSLILALCVTMFTGCSSASVEGSWKLVGVSGADNAASELTIAIGLVNMFGGNLVLNLEQGRYSMTVSMLGSTDTSRGSYSVSGNKMILDGDSVSYQLSGSTLRITESGATYTFNRVP